MATESTELVCPCSEGVCPALVPTDSGACTEYDECLAAEED